MDFGYLLYIKIYKIIVMKHVKFHLRGGVHLTNDRQTMQRLCSGKNVLFGSSQNIESKSKQFDKNNTNLIESCFVVLFSIKSTTAANCIAWYVVSLFEALINRLAKLNATLDKLNEWRKLFELNIISVFHLYQMFCNQKNTFQSISTVGSFPLFQSLYLQLIFWWNRNIFSGVFNCSWFG